ncbi:MAG: ferrochelatase [Chloroflexota bacterium]|nr:ferrochelatase [Chloroflexota bacterium]
MTTQYDCLLLTSFGGPEKPADVMPFLENVTRGRGIPRERLEAVAQHYLALGGTSPINDQNRALMGALSAEFARRGIALPIYWGNRNWDPFLADELRRLAADGHRRVLAFATSAYASYSGCRQYREDLAAALFETGLSGTVAVDKVRLYFDHPGFIGPFVDGLVRALTSLASDGVAAAEVRVLFTTHSIPDAMAAASGPPGRFDEGGAYVAQHVAAIERVIAGAAACDVEVPDHALVYQSRSGAAHVRWLEPDINDALRAAATAGVRVVVLVPIGFISDHIEVVWDLDNEARETSDELGLRVLRVATPGTQHAFVRGIADLVEERVRDAPPLAESELGPWPWICAVGCCRNLRADLPTVAGADSTVGTLISQVEQDHLLP